MQQTGEFGVPVWNVCALAVDQGGDDVPQCGQREVDLGRFLQALTGSSSLTLPLGSLKWREVENLALVRETVTTNSKRNETSSLFCTFQKHL